jgi:predicted nuclease with TOPRIM domain
MSEPETIEVSRDELESIIEEKVEARVEGEKTELREELEAARSRIDELESELESRPQIEITDEDHHIRGGDDE